MKKSTARLAAGLLAAGLFVGAAAAPSYAIDDSSWGRSVVADKPTKPTKPGDTTAPRKPSRPSAPGSHR